MTELTPVLTKNHAAFESVGAALGAIQQRMAALEAKATQQTARLSSSSGSSGSSGDCQRLKIIVENYLETATMAITPEPYATMPVENLLVPEREDVLMTQSRSEHVITGDFDRRRVVNAFVLAGHTLSVWGKVRLELFSDYGQTGDIVYDSGEVLARRRIPLQQLRIGIDPWGATYGDDLKASTPIWFDSVFAKSYRQTIYDKPVARLPDNWQAGNAVLGRYWSPQVNFSWNPTIQWIQGVEHSRSEGKTLHSEGTGDKYRRATFNLDWLSEEDANLLYQFIRESGGLHEFFFSMYPEYQYTLREIEHGFIGRFTGELPERTHTHAGAYSVPVEVEEI